MEVDPHHILIEDPDGSCALILDTLTSMDSGQYMCFAASAAGSASTLGKILVQGGWALAWWGPHLGGCGHGVLAVGAARVTSGMVGLTGVRVALRGDTVAPA